jgi:polysaccharide biosynthesis transport protein
MTPPERALGDSRGSEWRRPRIEASGFQRYFQTLRERFRMVVTVLVVTTLAAAAYLAVAEKVYEGEADLLVTPVSADEPVYTGLGLIRESNDPTRDVETAARLATTRDVAARVRRQLRLEESTRQLLKKVTAEPVAQSNIVQLTAKSDSKRAAKDLANAFGEGFVAERTAALKLQLAQRIPRLRERVAAGEGGSGPDSAAAQLAQLEALEASGDPTVRVETRAVEPPSPASPRPIPTMVAGILAGLILGVGGAFAMHALDPRLRREEQLRELYSLPVLARIPQEKRARTTAHGRRRFLIGPRRKVRRALPPGQLSPTVIEAYRTLRTMLAAARIDRGQGRSVLVTGPSPSEGKTTTAINLASSLALGGNRVVLIEADFRRPTVGEALGVRPHAGLGKVLMGQVNLEDALIPTKPFGDNLRALLVDSADDWLAEVLSLPRAETLLEEAESICDYVVIDSPPLTEVIDALPLAQQVDDVLLVVRLGNSKLPQLARLGDLLAQNGIAPSGFVVVGVGSSDEPSYYLSQQRERDLETFLPPDDDRPRAPAQA